MSSRCRNIIMFEYLCWAEKNQSHLATLRMTYVIRTWTQHWIISIWTVRAEGSCYCFQTQFSYHLSEHSLFVCSRIHLDRTAAEEEMCHFLLVSTQLTIIKENISSVVFTASPADGCRTLGDLGPSLQPLWHHRECGRELCVSERTDSTTAHK